MKITQRGYTLVELIVTISIISIMGGIGLFVLRSSNSRDRSKDALNRANLERVTEAIESYYYGVGVYPSKSTAANGNPLLNSANKYLNEYLEVWPDEFYYNTYLQSRVVTAYSITVRKYMDNNYFKVIVKGPTSNLSLSTAVRNSKNSILHCRRNTTNILTNVAACAVIN